MKPAFRAARLPVIAALALSLAAPFAQAQLLPHLPPLPLPNAGPLIDEARSTVSGAEAQARTELRGVRAEARRLLLRQHHDVIATDRAGEPVVRGEALALSPTPAALARAEADGFAIERRSTLGDLGVEIVVLRAPRGMSTRAAIERLRKLDPAGGYDFNHLYFGAGGGAGALKPREAGRAPPGDAGAPIGLIDGPIDLSHPALAGAHIVAKAFAGPSPPGAHGTAVASLLVGRDGAFSGAAPGARLFAADAFGAGPMGGSAEQIAQAFAWLAQQKPAVVNASIVGPPNAALAAVVRAVLAKGIAVVAAVGNDGPAAAPLYPAAYPGVIGVTGVDARRRVLPEENRGPQVMFAAPGADLAAAAPGGGYGAVRGASFAAPIVAGLLALRGAANLTREAIDLGAKGRDPVYGLGLVGESVRTAAAPLLTRR